MLPCEALIRKTMLVGAVGIVELPKLPIFQVDIVNIVQASIVYGGLPHGASLQRLVLRSGTQRDIVFKLWRDAIIGGSSRKNWLSGGTN